MFALFAKPTEANREEIEHVMDDGRAKGGIEYEREILMDPNDSEI